MISTQNWLNVPDVFLIVTWKCLVLLSSNFKSKFSETFNARARTLHKNSSFQLLKLDEMFWNFQCYVTQEHCTTLLLSSCPFLSLVVFLLFDKNVTFLKLHLTDLSSWIELKLVVTHNIRDKWLIVIVLHSKKTS